MKNQKPQSYFIQTYGCQMNESDSERFSTFLQNLGIQEEDHFQKADLIIINSCSVRQKAEDRINGFVNKIRDLTQDTNPTIVLTGCIARRIWDDSKYVTNSSQKSTVQRERELLETFPQVDVIVETKNFPSIGEKLGFQRNFDEKPEHYLSFKPKYKSSYQAYVPISTGCNHFCTFCIVPFSRGKEICRSASEIIREVFDLVQHGYKDITLLGQTVNRWINPNFIDEYEYNEALTSIPGLNEHPMGKKDLESWRLFFEKTIDGQDYSDVDLIMPKDFLQLLQVLDQIPGEWWTTWISSHPNYMTRELVKFIGESSRKSFFKEENVAGGHQRPYLHFALQSGSDRMLKRMNRRHTMNEFIKIVDEMNKNIDELMLSTDIIVGFVNESEQDFLDTIKAQKRCEFDMIYISEYSPRAGTASARLPDKIPPEEKAERKERLNDVLKEVALKKNKKLVGTLQKVLITGNDRKTGFAQGRTAHNKIVRITNEKSKKMEGTFVDVTITSCTPWALEGTISV